MAVVRAAQASYTPGGSGGSLAVGGMPEGYIFIFCVDCLFLFWHKM